MSDKISQAETLQLSSPKTPIQQLEAKKVSEPSSVTPKEPATVPSPSGLALALVERTKAQVGKKRSKFQKMKNKKNAGKLTVCEQLGLAIVPYTNFGPGGRQQTFPTNITGSDGGRPTSDQGITSDVLVPFTSQEQQSWESKEPKWLKYLNQILEDK